MPAQGDELWENCGWYRCIRPCMTPGACGNGNHHVLAYGDLVREMYALCNMACASSR